MPSSGCNLFSCLLPTIWPDKNSLTRKKIKTEKCIEILEFQTHQKMHPIEVPIDVNFRPQKSRFFKRSVMLGILSICHQLKRKTLDFLSVVGTEKKRIFLLLELKLFSILGKKVLQRFCSILENVSLEVNKRYPSVSGCSSCCRHDVTVVKDTTLLICLGKLQMTSNSFP